MKSIPGTMLQDLAKLQTTSVWVELLAISLPDGRTLRLANNTEPVTYGGHVYQAYAYEAVVTEITKEARMPAYALRLSGVENHLVQFLRGQAGGLEGQTLTAAMVRTDDLTADYSEFTTTYDIRGHADGDDWVELEIGGPNLYRFRFPFRRYMPNLCEVTFKGTLCGYSGDETSCNYTLNDCRTNKDNGARFGGTPGLSPQSLRVV